MSLQERRSSARSPGLCQPVLRGRSRGQAISQSILGNAIKIVTAYLWRKSLTYLY